jgi:single-strand DNA-binding protein
MNSLNSIILEGNVVRTPTVRQTPRGATVCTVGVAVNRLYKSADGVLQEETSFFDVNTWGNLAQTCSESCEKGRAVRVVGRLRQDRWVDQTGKNRSKVVIVADHMEFKTAAREAESLHGINHRAEKEFQDLLEAAQASLDESQEKTF